MHDALQTTAGEAPHRPNPGADPRADWLAQAKWDFRRGYTLLAVSLSGLIAAFAFVPSNLIEVIFQSAPSRGVTTNLRLVAIASVGLVMIFSLFAFGLRSISRGRQVEDQVR